MEKYINNKYLLSICIPTANRKIELTKQLICIQFQVRNLSKDLVQIIIGDNSEYIEQFVDLKEFSGLNIKYINNGKNIGYAKNVNSVISNADGEFCWLLSDDDFLLDNSIEIIINNLKKFHYCNYITFRCGGVYNGKLFNRDMYFQDLKKNYYESGREFLEKYWVSVCFISINIFRTDAVLVHMNKNNLFKDINEVFQNSLIGITFINEYGHVLVIKDILLNDNYGNKIYAPENINNVAVDKKFKLLKQLLSFKISKKILNELSRELLQNVVNYGFKSVVYSIEYRKIKEYQETYEKIYKDNLTSAKLKIASGIIYMLLKINKRLSKLMVQFILLFAKNRSYSKIKKQLDEIIVCSKSKITSKY